MLNRLVCRCAEKNVMTNEIVGFGGVNLFFLVILNELTNQFVIAIYRHGFKTLFVHFVLMFEPKKKL